MFVFAQLSPHDRRRDARCAKACPNTCNAASTHTRSRTITQAARNGGTPCPSLTSSQSCDSGCVSCQVGAWSAFSPCTTTCGDGVMTQSRVVTRDATCGCAACGKLVNSVSCNVATCARDCVLSMWSAWSTCSCPNGFDGTFTRQRDKLQAEMQGGACFPLSESSVSD